MGPEFELDEGIVMAKPAPIGRRWLRIVGNLMKLAFALACILALISLLVPSVSHCDSETMWRAVCANNLKQIQLALDGYHERFGVLPPAYVADSSGRRRHSWRVLILPFLDQQSLHDRYDFREPWNGPNNIKLLGEMPRVFDCPSRKLYRTSLTSYVAITGPGSLFPSTRSVEFADVADGLDHTLMIVEAANQSIPWTAPVDLDLRTMSFRINDPQNPGISSGHRGGANVILGDSRNGFLKESLPAKQLRSLITIAGRDWNPDDGSPSH
jgi:hypothetical protein